MATGERHEGGADVDRARDRVAAAASGDLSWPAGDRGNSDAALPGAAFASAERRGAAAIRSLDQPGTVVAGEQHERAFVQFQFGQQVEQFTDAPIHLFDPIAEAAVVRLAGESSAGIDRRMHGRVRQIQEKRTIGVFADERFGFVGVAFDDAALLLIGQQFRHLVVAHQRRDALAGRGRDPLHVVRVGNAEVAIEALASGKELGLVPQMPFADARRGVTAILELFGDSHLGRIQPLALSWEKHAGHRHPRTIAAGQELCSRDRTNGRRVERSQLHPFLRHPIQVRRALLRRSKGTDVGIA